MGASGELHHSRDELVDELSQVRRRGIMRVESSSHEKLQLPILREFVKIAAGKPRSFPLGLADLIKAAVDNLPEGLLKSVGATIFGFNSDLTDVKPDKWRKDAMKLYTGLGGDEFRKGGEREALTLIAAEVESIIASRLVETQMHVSQTLFRPAFNGSYIDRPAENLRLAAGIVEASLRKSRFFVVGDAGTGKSRFVLERVGLSDDEKDTIWVDAASEERLSAWLARFLGSVGIRSANSNSAVLKHRFFRYLQDHVSRDIFVIVDGISDPDNIDDLIPSDTPAFVIVTSRNRPSEGNLPCIHLDEMTSSEAVAMTVNLLPRSDEDEVRRLAAVVGYRPGLIEAACRFIATNPGISIDDFSKVLASDTVAGTDLISARSVDTLSITYRRLVDKLRNEYPTSFDLLGILAFGPPFVTKEYLGSYLLKKPYLKADDNLRAVVTLSAALRPLVKHCVVRETVGMVFVPPLIQAVLREIIPDQLDSVVGAASCVKARREELYNEGWSITAVAGRVLCDGVLAARLSDRNNNGDRLRLKGDLGGARWERLIERAWFRIIALECQVAAYTLKVGSADGILPQNRDAVLSAARGLPQLMREDAELTVALGVSAARDLVARGIDVSVPFETLLATIPPEEAKVTRLFEQKLQSPDGEIDLGTLVPYPLTDDYIVAVTTAAILAVQSSENTKVEEEPKE